MLATLLIGLCTGSIYGLMAFSVALVFRGTHKVNFAHGQLGALGVYLFLQLSILGDVSSIAGALVGILAAGLGGVAFGVLARRMERGDGQGHAIVPLIGSFAVFLIVRSVTVGIWSGQEPYRLPQLFGTGSVNVSGTAIPAGDLGALAVTVVVGLVLGLVLRYTRVGLEIRALVANPTAAQLLGLRTQRLENLVWFVGTALAAVAAFLYFQNTSLITGNVDLVLIPAFAIAAVGGFEHIGAVAISATLYGLCSQLIERYANFPAQSVVSLGVLVVLLFVMPRGILVQRSSRYA